MGNLSKFIFINKTYYFREKYNYIDGWEINNSLVELIAMRVALNHLNRNWMKNLKKISSQSIQKPQSNVIVQPGYFRQGGFYSIINYFKNSNTNLELKRNVNQFTVQSYEKVLLEKYHEFCAALDKKNFQHTSKYLSNTLYQEYKTMCKTAESRNKIDLSGWKLIKDAKKSKIVQSRIYQIKLTTLTSSDRWFQLTCKFSNQKGEEVYNILEKHEKNESFKFIKFNI